MFDGFTVGLAFSALFVSGCSAIVASWALIEVMAYKRSTHQVQFVTAEDEAKEIREDKHINKELSNSEFEAMMNAFGDRRTVKDEQEI